MILILVMTYSMLWQTQIKTPYIRQTADFLAFYTAGEIAEKDGPQYVYDQEKQLAVQERIQGKEKEPNELLSYNHLPYLIPILNLLSSNDYTASFMRWGFFLLTLQLISTMILSRLIRFGEKTENLLFFIGILLFYPTFISILKGQDSVIMLLGLSIFTLAFAKKKDTLAGIGLSLATVRPHIALFLAIPFLIKRRRIFWAFTVSASLLAIFSITLIGQDGTRQFVELLTISSRGEGYYLKPEVMFNLIGILARRLPFIAHGMLESIAWGIFGAGLLASAFLWWKSKKITFAHLGLGILFSVLTAPHLHYHDLAITVIPLLLGISIAIKKTAPEKLVALPLGLAFILFINQYLPQMYLIPYTAMFTGIFFFAKEIVNTHKKTE